MREVKGLFIMTLSSETGLPSRTQDALLFLLFEFQLVESCLTWVRFCFLVNYSFYASWAFHSIEKLGGPRKKKLNHC